MDKLEKYRIREVIGSCKTVAQLEVAANYASLACERYRSEVGSIGYIKLIADIQHYLGFMLGRITAK
jgi:hypothetical protein